MFRAATMPVRLLTSWTSARTSFRNLGISRKPIFTGFSQGQFCAGFLTPRAVELWWGSGTMKMMSTGRLDLAGLLVSVLRWLRPQRAPP